MDDVVVYERRSVASFTLVVFALALGLGGYVLVGLNQDGQPPADWPLAVAVWAGLGLVSWGVVRWRLPYADPLLLPCVLLLNGLGMAMIYRLDQATNPPMQSGRLQLGWAAAAVAVMLAVVVFLKDHRRLQRYTYLWFVLGLGLLLLPLVPGIGFANHGARVWIKLGTFSFQPGEVAKIVLSIAFAAYLTEKGDVLAKAGPRLLGLTLPRMRDLGPIAVMWGISMLILVFETDLGMSLLFFSLFVAMVYIATRRSSWAILGLLLVGVMGFLGYTYLGHVRVRFQAWLQPFSNYDQNWQIISAQFGFASGGLLGTGWGLGRPYLTPIAKSDFIAAALGEELGLVGLFAILLVYLIIVARVLRAALITRETFGALLAAGLAFVFGLQVFIIVGGVTRLLPLTGLTTPFMSQGGSSLISNYLLLGLLLTVTHQARKPQAQIETDEFSSLHDEATTAIPAVAAAGVRTPTSPSSASPAPTRTPQVTTPAMADRASDVDAPTQAIAPQAPFGGDAP
ncbi:MAG TPA: FtsW/RodA/SpoVE family cell cycle protein [Propioniciclava tarda]|nr:FtsW/RodA/SpoVE family cell cycle protein [Propioniciclava tarda]HQA31858.1 FtsW/RodA/SpoVE family cell cycle protein [Propioniciclava tarda]